MKLLYGAALLALGLGIGRMKDGSVELECPQPQPILSDYQRAVASIERTHPIPYRAIVCQAGACRYYTGHR